ncbi:MULTISPECIES: NUDIX hydrolase [Aeromonas]|uniref:NUDIX hydrolase n=1 Tax=Aeromonas TaxID=642 RepID=UPI001920194B|nr:MULTISPECIES: DNA mismatch repair protein MutT [Aeromonas]MBL0498243.1 DNA mismatch repair protein MutT [Aeromonas caviae]MBL0552827.1 DNA mismatch repair protein MutT [Aeromonas caviae]MBL0650413.1 DNA mismatch repair protein MutT [Aeromonas caviae]MDH0473324.1 DNA mismatch repair protein MutT [Aeromonas caviae]MDY7841496.1 DNA mismatch repair protein MutT [Aeromonas caviae]
MPRMSLDMVVLRLREERLELLLETRDRPPFAHCWQLPALRIDETRDRDLDAARHRLLAEWGLEHCYSEQVCTLGNLERDPRGWSTTLVYLCLADPDGGAVRGRWHPLDDLPGLQLAFDHGKLVAMGLERLRIKSRYSTLPLHLLGAEFTLSEVQRAFEIVLQTPMNTAAFRKRLHRADILVDTGRKRTGKQRPAILYRLESPCCVMFDQVMNGAEA